MRKRIYSSIIVLLLSALFIGYHLGHPLKGSMIRVSCFYFGRDNAKILHGFQEEMGKYGFGEGRNIAYNIYPLEAGLNRLP